MTVLQKSKYLLSSLAGTVVPNWQGWLFVQMTSYNGHIYQTRAFQCELGLSAEAEVMVNQVKPGRKCSSFCFTPAPPEFFQDYSCFNQSFSRTNSPTMTWMRSVVKNPHSKSASFSALLFYLIVLTQLHSFHLMSLFQILQLFSENWKIQHWKPLANKDSW